MSKEDADHLFVPEDIKILAEAKVLKSNTVYQDCMDLVQGFFAVKEIVETGKYKNRDTGDQVEISRRRKTMHPAAIEQGREGPIDTDDRFHDMIKTFVDENDGKARSIAMACFSAFRAYKDMAVWFDDVCSVYP